jgi:hypothetical protein
VLSRLEGSNPSLSAFPSGCRETLLMVPGKIGGIRFLRIPVYCNLFPCRAARRWVCPWSRPWWLVKDETCMTLEKFSTMLEKTMNNAVRQLGNNGSGAQKAPRR